MKYFPYPITARAIANCLGNDSAEVFTNALAGNDCLTFSDKLFSADELPFRVPVGMMKEFPAREATFAWRGAETRVFQVAYASVRQLKEPVRRAVAKWGAERVSYVFASSTGGLEYTEHAVQAGEVPAAALPGGSPLLRDHAMHATNDDLANYLGIKGYRYVVTTACSSSLKALKSAVRMLAHGLADAVVVGCADSLCRTTLFGFRSLGILHEGPTKPFSADRTGLTLGEGSAYVLLERSCEPEEALAWLSGVGECSDAFHPSSPDPTGKGALASMREALQVAGVKPNDVAHVCAHATGTTQNDSMESLAIDELLPHAPVTGTKSMTGHTLGAAGLTSLVLAIESLRTQTCMPTLRVAPVDPTIPLKIVQVATPLRMDHVLVNSFAFGGNNCSALISAKRVGS